MELGFISEGGECGELIRSIDWSKHPLGPMENWPQSLRTTLSIVINSRFPMFLMWGPNYFCFYNDAYRPSLGEHGKHPDAIGRPGKEVWAEIWPQIGSMLDGVLHQGVATWSEDILLPINRNGQLEDVYWTFSYSPVKDESGKPAGVFVAVTETTAKLQVIEKLNSGNAELEFAINAAELGTWDLNPKTNKFTANKRLKKWFGLPPESEIDLDIALNSIIDSDQSRVSKAILKALDYSSGGKYNIEYILKKQGDGNLRYVKAKGKCLFDEHKNPIRLNGTLQDISDEVTYRNALKKSENDFRNLILQAPVGMIILEGEDLTVELINDTYLKQIGKTRAETKNKTLWELIPEIKSDGLDHILKRVLATGVSYTVNEFSAAVIKDGARQTLYTKFVYEPLKDAEGKASRLMVVAIDITDTVNSKHHIEEAEERLRLATDAAGVGSFDLDMTTGAIKSSEIFDKIFGFDKQVKRGDYASVIHPGDKEVRLNAHKRALETGNIFYEARLIKKNEEIAWIRVEGKILYNADGRAIRMLGTVLDITPERTAKIQLEQINQQLEIALETGKIGSYIVNLDNKRVNLSDQFIRNYGLKNTTRITYDELFEFIDRIYREEVAAAIANAIERKTVYQAEYQIRLSNNNELRWIRESGKAQYDASGKATHFIAVSFDITENKALQQQKDEFIGIASHELKTPVTSIKAYTQMLERILRRKGDEKEADLMVKMDSQLNRLTDLIGDLLDVTKINSGKLQYNHTHFDFNEMIGNVAEEVQRTSDTHQIVYDLKDVGLIYADRERVSQVVTNLLTNALKYSPSAEKIIIHSYIEDDNVIVCVEDFGIGIAEEKLNKVFEQFYRVSGTMQHTFPGLGLGLYISSEIIKREGGRIWVNSRIGEGSKFCFSIPKSRDNNY